MRQTALACKRKIQELREMLEMIEWYQQSCNFAPSCPWCDNYKHEGHNEHCRLAQEIRSLSVSCEE